MQPFGSKSTLTRRKMHPLLGQAHGQQHVFALPILRMVPCSCCAALIVPPQLEDVSQLCPPCAAACSNEEDQSQQPTEADYEDSLFSERFFEPEAFNDSSCSSTRAATDDSPHADLHPLEASLPDEFCNEDTPDHLYAKLQDLLVDTGDGGAAGQAVQIREELWLKVHKNFYLSNCWVGGADARSEDLERFGTNVSHYQEVMRRLSWDVPLGIVALNLSRRICLGITGCDGKHVEKAHLSSALHYLRNYPSLSLGFAWCRSGCGRFELCTLECSRTPCFDRAALKNIHRLHERLMKTLVLTFPHVVFWRNKS